MIIENKFFKSEKDYLLEQKEGLKKAIDNLDSRFKKDQIDREKFLKQNAEFAKRQEKLNKEFEKLNRR